MLSEPSSPTPTSCAACGRPIDPQHRVRITALRPVHTDWLARRHPEWSGQGPVCRECLLESAAGWITDRLSQERGELSGIEADVVRMAATHQSLATHVDDEFRRTATFGNRIADGVARVGGSWSFVLGMIFAIVLWIGFNSLRGGEAVDPFPFILLNLVLSCVAALQAPVILMSQNRAQQRDRAQADSDYRINLKAELEIASLHEKVDHILNTQWERMVEMQELQLELLDDLRVGRMAVDRGAAIDVP